MKRTFASLATLVVVVVTISLPDRAFADGSFGQWARARGYTPPGPIDWDCEADEQEMTSIDGVRSYTNLVVLDLHHNRISSLSANAFQGLTNLQKLHLYDNHISSLDANAFQGLTNLQGLSLSQNRLSSLDANQFQGLPNLQTLSLGGNQLSLPTPISSRA